MIQSKIIKICAVVALVTVLLALGIGYAAVSKDLALDAQINGQTQNEVFITDINVKGGGTLNSSSFISTVLNSSIKIDKTGLQQMTIEVTVRNNNKNEPYFYIDTVYGSGDLFYDNEDIDFTVNMNPGDWVIYDAQNNYKGSSSVVPANGEKSFEVTFIYKGSEPDPVLDLTSFLNFRFRKLEDTQVVMLEYGNQKFFDCFVREEITADTVATFPAAPTISATTTSDNVARANKGAVPFYDGASVKVGSLDKEVSAPIKCTVYDSLTSSLSDTAFEASDYTVNNFLVLNDITDRGTTAVIPANLEWNVDFDGKTVTHVYSGEYTKGYESYGNKLIYMKNASVLNLKSTDAGGIQFSYDTTSDVTSPAALAELTTGTLVDCIKRIQKEGEELTAADISEAKVTENSPKLTITGGIYKTTSGANFLSVRYGGKIIVRDATITSGGNCFDVGLPAQNEYDLTAALCAEWTTSANNEYNNKLADFNAGKTTDEPLVPVAWDALYNAGTAYTAHIEVIDSTVTSTAKNVFHTKSRQIVFCNLVRSTLTSAQNVIIADDDSESNTAVAPKSIHVWDNVKIYEYDCKLDCGGENSADNLNKNYSHFKTNGAKMYYSGPISYGYFDSTKTTNGKIDNNPQLNSSLVGLADDTGLHGRNFRVKNYITFSTDPTKPEDIPTIKQQQETWFYIRNVNVEDEILYGDKEKTPLRIGDEIQFLSREHLDGADHRVLSLTSNKTGVELQADHNTATQRWTFVGLETAGNEYYYAIASYERPEMVISVNADNTLTMANYSTSNNYDKWNFKFNIGKGNNPYNVCYYFSCLNPDTDISQSIQSGPKADVLDAAGRVIKVSSEISNKRLWILTTHQTNKSPTS